MLGLDRGDLLFPLLDPTSAWVTIVVPSFGVSTQDAYAWWDREGGPDKVRPTSAKVRGTSEHRHSESGNDLQSVVAAHHPEIGRIIAALRKAGAFYAAMSGSGSAVFGLFDHRPAAERAARGVKKSSGRALVTRTVNRAAYQRLAGIPAHRINLPFAPRSLGHS